MASGGKKSGGGGGRTLEGRHVIGLFLLMLLFSGIFFTLGFVMGRSQYNSDVRASSPDLPPSVKDRPRGWNDSRAAKPGSPDSKSRNGGTPANTSQPDWDFYHAGEPKKSVDRLNPGPAAKSPEKPAPIAASAGAGNAPSANAAKTKPLLDPPAIPAGAIVLQVAALTKEADALALAEVLKKKGFPSFVTSPGADHYYRVQVGPYADSQSSNIAKKDLEKAGFKAIPKR